MFCLRGYSLTERDRDYYDAERVCNGYDSRGVRLGMDLEDRDPYFENGGEKIPFREVVCTKLHIMHSSISHCIHSHVRAFLDLV